MAIPRDEVLRRLSMLLYRAEPDDALRVAANGNDLSQSPGVAAFARERCRGWPG